MHMFTYMYVCIYIHILGMQHFLCSMIVVPMSYFINSIELAEELVVVFRHSVSRWVIYRLVPGTLSGGIFLLAV